MSGQATIDYAGLVWLSALGLVQVLALLVLYGLRSDWRRQGLVGWVLMGSFAIKAIIFSMILWRSLFGPLGPGVWTVAFIAFDLVQFGWLFLVIKQQRQQRRDAKERRRGDGP